MLRPHVGVLRAELVALVAVGFHCSLATARVLSRGDGLKMIRINALPVAAQMVELKPFLDLPPKNGVGDAVRHHHLCPAPELSVPGAV
jgi:hypothetical protein